MSITADCIRSSFLAEMPAVEQVGEFMPSRMLNSMTTCTKKNSVLLQQQMAALTKNLFLKLC